MSALEIVALIQSENPPEVTPWEQVARNLAMLEADQYVGHLLIGPYKTMLEMDPRVAGVRLVPTPIQDEFIADTIEPWLTPDGEIEMVFPLGAGALELVSASMRDRPNEYAMVAEWLGLPPETLTAVLAIQFIFWHELWHVIQLREFAGTPVEWQAEMDLEKIKNPFAGTDLAKRPPEVLMELLRPMSEQGTEFRGFESLEALIFYKSTMHRRLKYEAEADRFAVRMMLLR
jgi:hypothetical protein